MPRHNIIDQSAGGLVITEKLVQISDEKIKGILAQAYECARRDARAVHWYDCSITILTNAGLLLVTLMTANFHDVFGLKGETLQHGAWAVWLLLVAVGLFAACRRSCEQSKDEHEERDKAVEEIWQAACK